MNFFIGYLLILTAVDGLMCDVEVNFHEARAPEKYPPSEKNSNKIYGAARNGRDVDEAGKITFGAVYAVDKSGSVSDQTASFPDSVSGLRRKPKARMTVYDCAKLVCFLFVDKLLGTGAPQESSGDLDEAPSSLERRIGLGRWNEYADEILSRNWTLLLKDRLVAYLKRRIETFVRDDSILLQGRGRRRDQKMLALMVMGFMLMASILIPTGFQFLTVLGGKSLLMAKMALIMSAISGLKKIATSNVGYGFYHADGHHHHDHHSHHGFHDKVYKENPQQGGPFGFNL